MGDVSAWFVVNVNGEYRKISKLQLLLDYQLTRVSVTKGFIERWWKLLQSMKNVSCNWKWTCSNCWITRSNLQHSVLEMCFLKPSTIKPYPILKLITIHATVDSKGMLIRMLCLSILVLPLHFLMQCRG